MRDEQFFDLCSELGLQAPHAEDATQRQNQEYAGLHQHTTGLVQDSQQYRETFEEPRSVRSVAGQKFTDFDEDEKNSYKKYDVTEITEQNLSLSLLDEWDGLGVPQIWNIWGRPVSSWITHRNYALVSMKGTSIRFKVSMWMTVLDHRYRQQALLRNQQKGIYDKVGRLTQCRKQQHWLQLRRRHQRASQKTPVVVHRFFNTDDLLTNWKCRSCSHILWSWRDQKWEKQSQFFLTDGFTHSPKIPRVAVLWIGEVEDANSIDDLITSASTLGGPILDENSWFQDCTRTQEDRNKKEASRNKSPQEKAKLNQRGDLLRAVRLVGWSTVATKKPEIYWKPQ